MKFHAAAALHVLEKLRRFTAALSASAVGRGSVTVAGSSVLISHCGAMSTSCQGMELCQREGGLGECRLRASLGTDVSWIDFGHVQFNAQQQPSSPNPPGNGILHGLQSLSELLQTVVNTGDELSRNWDWEHDELQRVAK